jgi:SAM-dependent methyltransferase
MSLRLYTDYAPWWPLFAEPGYYAGEAATILSALREEHGRAPGTILELGSGGGSLASHLKAAAKLTLVDPAPAMLAVSRALNPGVEHIKADMRTLRLGRTFDAVVIHDAINYMTTSDDLHRALATARAHLALGGVLMVLPDDTRETFKPGLGTGGRDGADGRGLRYLCWTNGPDGSTYSVDFGLLIRDASGSVEHLHERHTFGLFDREAWRVVFSRAGFGAPRIVRDRWREDVFVARAVALPRGNDARHLTQLKRLAFRTTERSDV